jgi:hypothetical protein
MPWSPRSVGHIRDVAHPAISNTGQDRAAAVPAASIDPARATFVSVCE